MGSIRSERSKEIVSDCDRVVEITCMVDNESFYMKGEVQKGLFINSYDKIYGILDDDIFFLTDKQLKNFSIKIIPNIE